MATSMPGKSGVPDLNEPTLERHQKDAETHITNDEALTATKEELEQCEAAMAAARVLYESPIGIIYDDPETFMKMLGAIQTRIWDLKSQEEYFEKCTNRLESS